MSMKSINAALYLIGASSLALGCGLSATAHAQSKDTTSEAGVADIIVTAQRVAQNLQDVPVSVTVINSEVLSTHSLNDMRQISLVAPSLQLGHENNFAIRGVGTLTVQTTIDPAVAVSLDEVNLGRTNLYENLFNDVSQVEVLSGPQGLLFGKNASAGLVNITTNRPKLGVTEGQADVEYNLRDTTPSNGQGVIVRLMGNFPVTDNSALRITGVYSFQEPVARGYRRIPGSNYRFEQNVKNLQIRAKYLIEPDDNLSVYLAGSYGKQKGNSSVIFRSLGAGSLWTNILAADGFVASPNLLSYKINGDLYRDQETYSGQIRIGYSFNDGWELVNIAALAGFKNSAISEEEFEEPVAASPVFPEGSPNKYRQFSNELRLVLPQESKLTGQFGLYYLHVQEDSFLRFGGHFFLPPAARIGFPFCVGATPTPGPPPACNRSNSFFFGFDNQYDLTNESYAGFGQLSYELDEGLKLIAGGRLTHDIVSINTIQNQGFYFIQIGGPTGRFSDSTKKTNFSYKVGAQYEPNANIMVYGNYATGYKAPGTNRSALVAGVDLIVREETSKNFEIGAKTNWFGNRLIANIALFHTKYKDYQTQAFDTAAGGQTLRNAAALTTKGIELNLIAKPVQGLSLSGSATILDAKFDDFEGAPCFPGQGCVLPNSIFNAAGQPTAMAPKFTSTIDATYEFPIGGSASLFVNGNFYHRSRVNFQPSPNPKTSLGSIDVLGAAVGVNFDEKYRFSVFCKNCNDQRFPSYVFNYPVDALSNINTTLQVWGFNSVRTIGAAFSAKF